MSSRNLFADTKIASAVLSTRRSVQFLAALYIHTLVFLILVVFSRNVFSATIRAVLLPLLP
jgi:ABC-type polysaccharide/polyol phosphate export permease